jgi:hypothetical protein
LTLAAFSGKLANIRNMGLFSRTKERERFYLLPGMGGRNLRRKRKMIMKWAVAAAIVTSAVLGALLYWMGTR